MPSTTSLIEAPLAPDELARRWQSMCADTTYEDIAGKIEITEWGEILMTPVGKSHGIAAMRIGEALRSVLGGHTMAEVGVATPIGVRAHDVAWCSDDFLSGPPEEMPLSRAPELCVEIVSASNAIPKLGEKAVAYINSNAVDVDRLSVDAEDRDLCSRRAEERDVVRCRCCNAFRLTSS